MSSDILVIPLPMWWFRYHWQIWIFPGNCENLQIHSKTIVKHSTCRLQLYIINFDKCASLAELQSKTQKPCTSCPKKVIPLPEYNSYIPILCTEFQKLNSIFSYSAIKGIVLI